jgi:hypothetical protein
MIAFFDDAGFILGSYVLTFATMGLLAWQYARRGRKLAEQVPDEDKYWT